MDRKIIAGELLKVAKLLSAEDEGREIGSVYLHISNSGVTFKIVDKGFGPTIVVYSSSFCNAINELQVITHKEALAALGELFTECSKEEYSKEYSGGLASLSEKKIPHQLPETMYGEYSGEDSNEKPETKKAWQDEGYGQKLRNLEKRRWDEMEEGNDPRHQEQVERDYQRWFKSVTQKFKHVGVVLQVIGEDKIRNFFDAGWSIQEAVQYIHNQI